MLLIFSCFDPSHSSIYHVYRSNVASGAGLRLHSDAAVVCKESMKKRPASVSSPVTARKSISRTCDQVLPGSANSVSSGLSRSCNHPPLLSSPSSSPYTNQKRKPLTSGQFLKIPENFTGPQDITLNLNF